jgi:hypothetical protein
VEDNVIKSSLGGKKKMEKKIIITIGLKAEEYTVTKKLIVPSLSAYLAPLLFVFSTKDKKKIYIISFFFASSLLLYKQKKNLTFFGRKLLVFFQMNHMAVRNLNFF